MDKEQRRAKDEAAAVRREKFRDADWLLGRQFEGKLAVHDFLYGQVARVKARWTVVSVTGTLVRLRATVDGDTVAVVDLLSNKLADSEIKEV